MLTNSNVFSTKFTECETIVNTTILRGLNSTKCYQPFICEFIAFPKKQWWPGEIRATASWNRHGSNTIYTETRYVSFSFIIPVNFKFCNWLKFPIHFFVNPNHHCWTTHITRCTHIIKSPQSLGCLCPQHTEILCYNFQTSTVTSLKA